MGRGKCPSSGGLLSGGRVVRGGDVRSPSVLVPVIIKINLASSHSLLASFLWSLSTVSSSLSKKTNLDKEILSNPQFRGIIGWVVVVVGAFSAEGSTPPLAYLILNHRPFPQRVHCIVHGIRISMKFSIGPLHNSQVEASFVSSLLSLQFAHFGKYLVKLLLKPKEGVVKQKFE